MKTENKIPVAIFGRVSTLGQEFDRQVTDLTRVADKLGYEVVEVITEKISGAKSTEERKGVQQLIASAKAGKFQKVLVSEVSRLGRSTLETLKLVEELHQLNISIYLQDLSTETLNEKGEMNMQTEIMLHMLSLFAKNERRNTIDRIRSGMALAKENGIHCGRPSGIVESEEQILIKYKAVVKSLELGLSVRKCCKLHDLSLGTVAKVRKVWSSQDMNQAA